MRYVVGIALSMGVTWLARYVGSIANVLPNRTGGGQLDDQPVLSEMREETGRIDDLLRHPDSRFGDLTLHQGAHGGARAGGSRIRLRATHERRVSWPSITGDVHA